MARTFTKIGKEITIAAKAGGTDPDSNPRLRVLIQTAKKENMPKDNVDRAIKRAVEKGMDDYKEINYEGYGPHGIAVFVETATDNNTRTVANIRSYFNKNGGSLGTTLITNAHSRFPERKVWILKNWSWRSSILVWKI